MIDLESALKQYLNYKLPTNHYAVSVIMPFVGFMYEDKKISVRIDSGPHNEMLYTFYLSDVINEDYRL